MLFLQYPKCTTCKRAKKFLDENNISYENRHIVEANPTKEELSLWLKLSDMPIKKFFNTSGVVYRELGMKDKVNTLSEDELLDILSSNGMLVKRPLLILDDKVLIGFKEELWKENLGK